MIQIRSDLALESLLEPVARMWRLSASKILSIEETCPPGESSPVFTVKGRYTAMGWTEWTQGFQYGSALLQFDATGDERFLELGRERTRDVMAPHLTHFGVHDHGFNNVSTYGNLRRMAREGRIDVPQSELDFWELALACSGAVQARRWTAVQGGGYIYSFNGPHSLFADTMRTLRSLSLGHILGQTMLGENDERISLVDRMIEHARTTARYAVFYGEGRDAYDVLGRVAHESIFNTNDGRYRCPNSQQGYSPFTTWTRGLAWVVLGYPEQIEFLRAAGLSSPEVEAFMLRAARAAADFYIEHTPIDGVPYWDTGAPGLARLGDYLDRPADLVNDEEPVDSSAAAIAAQGLIRLGRVLEAEDAPAARRYFQAGLTVLARLLEDDYLSLDESHQGLLLHSVYHRPNGWDHIPPGRKVPWGESSMWGDYHLRECALLVERIARGGEYYTFFGPGRAS